MSSPRLVFFGTRCFFADHVFDQLITHGYEITARIVPGYRSAPKPFQALDGRARSFGTSLPIVGNTVSDGMSRRPEPVPTMMVHDHHSSETIGMLASFNADIAIVCCYPARLPKRVIDCTRLGGLNIHPSPLPAYRGPEPLFWMYRDGVETGGVSIHRLTPDLDTGDLVAQEPISIDIGKPGDELWRESAELSARLLLDVLPELEGRLRTATPQASRGASYQSWPTSDDLLIDPLEWDASHLFHFCRGVLPLGYAPSIRTPHGYREIVRVDGYVDSTSNDESASQHEEALITCRTGAVSARLATG